MSKVNSKPNKRKLVKNIMNIVLISLTGCTGIIFFALYFNIFDTGIFAEYSVVLTAVSVGIISALTVLTIMFYELSKDFVYKLFLLTVILISSSIILIYCLQISGFWDKIDSVEDFRRFIASFGGYAVILFILIQFLQVVVLPIPAFITVGAGVLLFGPFYGAVYSCIGIISGSVLAFFIGRVFGYPVAKWLVGKDSLDKWLKNIEGKDKIILTFMFLFPFFPDDVLCFVAGITTISPIFFTVMIFIVRIISVFASSFSMNNNIIPYTTWWGILLWGAFIALTVLLTILIYKKGDKIERYIQSKFKKKKNKKL